TQLIAFPTPINARLAEITTTRAPGAAPPTWVPVVNVRSSPAAMPETKLPCPPVTPSVSTEGETSVRQDESVLATLTHPVDDRLRTIFVDPLDSWNDGWVGSTPVSMTAMVTPVPVSSVP